MKKLLVILIIILSFTIFGCKKKAGELYQCSEDKVCHTFKIHYSKGYYLVKCPYTMDELNFSGCVRISNGVWEFTDTQGKLVKLSGDVSMEEVQEEK